MNYKKSILYLLLSIFALIFIYNYMLPYFVSQSYIANNMGMGMGMHMRESINNNVQYNYNNLVNIIVFIIVILGSFLMLDKIIFASKSKKCKKCGLTIENNLWKVCPRCGNHLHQSKEE